MRDKCQGFRLYLKDFRSYEPRHKTENWYILWLSLLCHLCKSGRVSRYLRIFKLKHLTFKLTFISSHSNSNQDIAW